MKQLIFGLVTLCTYAAEVNLILWFALKDRIAKILNIEDYYL